MPSCPSLGNEHRAPAHRDAGNTGDEGLGLDVPEAHRRGFRRRPATVAEIDVVAPTGQSLSGSHPDRDVVAAKVFWGESVFVQERIDAAGGVVAAREVAEKRIDAAGGVVAAIRVVQERIAAAGGVVAAREVAEKRT